MKKKIWCKATAAACIRQLRKMGYLKGGRSIKKPFHGCKTCIRLGRKCRTCGGH